jgi:hypothetical protein
LQPSPVSQPEWAALRPLPLAEYIPRLFAAIDEMRSKNFFTEINESIVRCKKIRVKIYAGSAQKRQGSA